MYFSIKKVIKTINVMLGNIKWLFFFSIIIFLSCEQQCPMEKMAEDMAIDFCHCVDSIKKTDYKSEDELKVKLDECLIKYSLNMVKMNLDSSGILMLNEKVKNYLNENCPNLVTKDMFSKWRKTSINTKINPSKCKEFFTDGEYALVGVNINVRIIRKGNKNINIINDLNCYSLSEVVWLDDCKYKLVMLETDCIQDKYMIGQSSMIKIIDIKGDTVYYDMELNGLIKPGIMRKISSKTG